MKFPNPVSIMWIAELINAEIVGNTASQAYGINEIHKVEEGDLCFVDHPKYYRTCLNSAATHIIINTKQVALPDGKNLLVVNEPFEAYLKIINQFRPFHPTKILQNENAIIGERTVIMPKCLLARMLRSAMTASFILM
jgi:UDP-3-O-[3-hydroxymyristoyl] glucosamine N-acyltransferase